MSAFYVKKSDGTFEYFDINKIRQSLKRSGVKKNNIEKIIEQIKTEIYDGISSDLIYQRISELLRKYEKKAYLRYNLPNAVAKLGPDGFAFEAFLVEVFKKKGYKKIFRGRKIRGKCMTHELDVVGENDFEKLTIEAKFHNSRSKKTDFQVILYMKARFEDLEKGGYYGQKKPKQIIVTNTKFTDNAKKYAKCSGVDVLSWNYPKMKNLHDLILDSNIHPVTAVFSLSKNVRNELISKKIVTIDQLIKNDFQALNELKTLSKKKKQDIIEEVEEFFIKNI